MNGLNILPSSQNVGTHEFRGPATWRAGTVATAPTKRQD